MGYSPDHKGYLCLYVPSGCTYISRDVVFNESVFPFAKQPNQITSDPRPTIHSFIPHIKSISSHLDPPISSPQSTGPSRPCDLSLAHSPPRSLSDSSSTQNPNSHSSSVDSSSSPNPITHSDFTSSPITQ